MLRGSGTLGHRIQAVYMESALWSFCSRAHAQQTERRHQKPYACQASSTTPSNAPPLGLEEQTMRLELLGGIFDLPLVPPLPYFRAIKLQSTCMRRWELKEVLGSSITSAGPLVPNTAETLLFFHRPIYPDNWDERPNNLGSLT